MRDHIFLGGQRYDLAFDPQTGARRWATTVRPSQAGDPGDLVLAEWRVDGPDFFSFEQIRPNESIGYLGRDRGENTDGRWEGIDTLGPLINVLDLDDHDVSHDLSIPGTNTFIPGSLSSHPPLISNGYFTTDTTGWTTGGTNTIEVSSEQALFGANSLKVTYQDNDNFASTDNITATAAPHVQDVWLYVPSDFDGTDVRLQRVGFTSATGVGNVQADLTLVDQWQRLLIDNFTPDAGDLNGVLRVTAFGSPPSAGKTLYLDGARFQLWPFASLIPGGNTATVAANGFARATGPKGTEYGWVTRGTTPAKLDLTDMTLQPTVENFSEVATSIIATEAANADVEVSVGFNEAPYRVLTTIGDGDAHDHWQENASGEVVRIFGEAPDRVVGLEGREAKGNILTGTITMQNPNWQVVAENIGDRPLTMTGFAMDGRFWVIGTTIGPHVLDREASDFFNLIPEIFSDDDNCRGMTSWFVAGVVIPLSDGVRFQKGSRGESFGPELFTSHDSRVRGIPTSFASTTKWGYLLLYDEPNDDSYLLACRPADLDDGHRHPISFFTLARLPGIESRFISAIGKARSSRTLDTMVLGHDTNAAWFSLGRTAREIDDTAYNYAPSGTTFLTEMRRQPGLIKDIEAIEFETGGVMDSNKTVTVGFSLDDGAAAEFPFVQTSGFKRQLAATGAGVPDARFHGGRRLKPQVSYATNDPLRAPQLIGTLRTYYRIRGETVRIYRALLELRETEAKTPDELQDELLDWMENSGPVALLDPDNDRGYVRVRVNGIQEQEDRGGADDSARGSVRIADVELTEWSTS